MMVKNNRRLLKICAHLKTAVTEATYNYAAFDPISSLPNAPLGSIEKIDERLANAQEKGLIQLRLLDPNLGAEVSGVNLQNPLSPEQITAVYDALVRHKVLVFRKADINNEQQVRFTHELSTASPNVGPPTLGHTVFGHVPGYPEVLSIYQGPKTQPKNLDRYKAMNDPANVGSWIGFHCDITACVNPPAIGMLRGDVIPEGIGNTRFGNLAAAYRTLPKELKEAVLPLKAEHEFKYGKTDKSEAGRAIASRKMVSHHPLVTVHPDSGETILYNSPGFLKFIVGQENDPSLLHKIWEHSVAYTITHVWEKGDLVVWDERSTTHCAPTDVFFTGKERQLYRTTLVGQILQGLNGSTSEIVEGVPMRSCEEELKSGMHANRASMGYNGGMKIGEVATTNFEVQETKNF